MTLNLNWLTEQSSPGIAAGRRVAEIVVIDLAPAFAGASADEFEERLNFVLRQVDASAGRIVLLLDLGALDPIGHLSQRHEAVQAELDQAVRDGDWERAARRTYEAGQIEQAIAAAHWLHAEHGPEEDKLVD